MNVTVAGRRTGRLPAGFRLDFDPSLQEPEPGVLVGGQPLRLLRLSETGRSALDELREGAVASPAAGTLARRLVDAGLAHPVPPSTAAVDALTVVVPVYDRASGLEECLAALGGAHPIVVVDDGSADPTGIAAVAQRHGARLLRVQRNRGPASARNAGLALVGSPLVAFVDSDTLPGGVQLADLARHLLDPAVGAVAPRIVARGDADAGAGARCTLDLGPRPAGVRPYTTVSYVPSAVLVARREALLDAATNGAVFDEALRVGEDVDLVWRLNQADWRVRYAPDVVVPHTEPPGARALLVRRFRYGTSAAALARRHPGYVAPFVLHPAFTACVVCAIRLRPRIAVAGAIGALLQVDRIVRRAGLPWRQRLAGTARGLGQTYVGLGRWLTQLAGPALLGLLAVGSRRSRASAAALLAADVLAAHPGRRRPLTLIRFAATVLADEMAYGAGVTAGCLQQHTLRPWLPILTTSEIKR